LAQFCSAKTERAVSEHPDRHTTPETLARALQDMGEIDLGCYRVDSNKDNVGSRYSTSPW
jgi:hypothetical protein